MAKKKASRPSSPADSDKQQAAGWTISSQSGIVTIWESRNEAGRPAYAVTLNQNRQPVPPAADYEGAASVMLAFQKLERGDNLKERDSLGLD
ncbi:MAG: hypothetical protein GXX96_10290 [Planctomycetaceae bacterium]|jgi:hypothetical protein|nr:hypothetical protein [Planctomycetaceae bacterium]